MAALYIDVKVAEPWLAACSQAEQCAAARQHNTLSIVTLGATDPGQAHRSIQNKKARFYHEKDEKEINDRGEKMFQGPASSLRDDGLEVEHL